MKILSNDCNKVNKLIKVNKRIHNYNCTIRL